jgi:hypothetical protein
MHSLSLENAHDHVSSLSPPIIPTNVAYKVASVRSGSSMTWLQHFLARLLDEQRLWRNVLVQLIDRGEEYWVMLFVCWLEQVCR